MQSLCGDHVEGVVAVRGEQHEGTLGISAAKGCDELTMFLRDVIELAALTREANGQSA